MRTSAVWLFIMTVPVNINSLCDHKEAPVYRQDNSIVPIVSVKKSKNLFLRSTNTIRNEHVNLDILRITWWYSPDVYGFGIFSTNNFIYKSLMLQRTNCQLIPPIRHTSPRSEGILQAR
jgi:hypothetical protein